MTLQEATSFFETYRDAFNRLDGDALADLWHGSSGITDTRDGLGRLTWWPSDAPMRANHRALCDHYRKAGYGRADFEIVHHEVMGPNHAFTRLHWRIARGDGSLLQAFGTGYQWLRTAAGPRVLLATAFEEDIQEMKHHAAA